MSYSSGGRIGNCSTIKKFREMPPNFCFVQKSRGNEFRFARRQSSLSIDLLVRIRGTLFVKPTRGSIVARNVRVSVALVTSRKPISAGFVACPKFFSISE